MHAVVHADAQDERESDHVRRIQGQAEEAHDAERQDHAHHQRCQGNEGVARAAKINHEHQNNYQVRIEPGPLEAALHGLEPFHGRERLARRLGVDGLNLIGEVFERLEVPQRILGEDTQQPLAARADVAGAKIRRQVRQIDRGRSRNIMEPVQVLRQIGGSLLFKKLQTLLNDHG